jgi:prophage regulatory protein
MVDAPAADDRLLKLAQVKEMTGLGRTMIYRMIRAGTFPQPYKPGGYASRWSEAEVKTWRESQRQPSKAA